MHAQGSCASKAFQVSTSNLNSSLMRTQIAGRIKRQCTLHFGIAGNRSCNKYLSLSSPVENITKV
jgi:hypothetical protein